MSTFVFTLKFMLYSVCEQMLSLPVVVTMTKRLHPSKPAAAMLVCNNACAYE